MKKKNVDEILKDLDCSYAYHLGRKEVAMKKGFDTFSENYHRGALGVIEDIYCSALGIDSLDKTGQSFIRHLRKRMKRSSVYKKTRKKFR